MAIATAAAIAKETTVKVTNNVDTSDSTVPGWPAVPSFDRFGEQPAPEPRRRRILVVLGTVVSSLLVASGVVAGVVRLPYDTVGPGSTRVVNDVVSVQGHNTYPPQGQILYATVAVRERVSALQALVGWLDPNTDVVPEKEVRGNIPPDQYRRLNIEAMNDSKTTAEVLALNHLGYTNIGAGARVEAVSPGSPAAAVLQPNDVILAVNDTPISTAGDAVEAIRSRRPGDELRLRISRADGPAHDVSATLAAAEDGRPLLGVRLTTKVQLPFDISIDSGQVVGPSAGLAYALELLDLLTAGELTGGLKIAATGELRVDGTVGPVGGVAQKVVTVERAGADVFLVPKDNLVEAQSRAGRDLQVRAVSSFGEALEALGSLQGSNALALAKPSPGT
jgi:PDZ domain-containing protein